ncbi:MbnP family protein [Algibacter mikhailovii]|uniref:Copper-binding protein MbnP-like domain-containing protein n=1 Tax=Algibacter mikhailovii TaxID=425498 RepID=A0A918VB45_9FLAO|nr:MbnP family protein [Algibacter mikhailovii]GGZ84870.1 hypothetical protein GCM10007028_23650 [Algibacter mikhailovii]
MKNTILFLLILSSFTLITSCNENNEYESSQFNLTFNFSHSWDEKTVTNTDFNTIQFTNAHGESLSITKLRYLISRITFEKPNGETLTLDGYNLVDVTNNSNTSFTPIPKIPEGTYSKVSFIFGFNNEDNYDLNYPDLNSVSWNVPEMLGGGYHYMQLEGKFIDNSSTETSYAYHTIRAVNNRVTPQVFKDTFFEVDLGEVTILNDTTFHINMNISKWFDTPNIWNLNDLNNMLMPNFDAQIDMFENGQNVFSLKSIKP